MTLAQTLKDLLPNVRAVTDQVRAHVTELQLRVEALQDERDMLLARYLTRESYIDVLCAQIDRKADAYQATVARRLELGLRDAASGRTPSPGTVGAWLPTVLNGRAVGKDDSTRLLSALRDPSGRDFDDAPLTQIAATFLLREPMKAATRAVVEAISPWPFTDTADLGEAVARLDAIGAELQGLERELGGIREDASAVGMDVTGFFRPEPIAAEFDAIPGMREAKKYALARRLAEDDARANRALITDDLIESYRHRIEGGEFTHLI